MSLNPLEGGIAAMVVVLVGVALFVFAMNSCTEERQRDFRARCERNGGTIVEALTSGGGTSLVCRPAGTTGDIVFPPEERTVVVPVRVH